MAPDNISNDQPPPETTTTPLLRRTFCRLPSTLKLKTSLLSELSGAVGDLGTYIPIVLALSLVNNLDLTTTLIFTSLYNILTGFFFGLPMPVQPMKSIAAVAISESPPLTIPQISAAGLSVAAVLLFLGTTGLMSFLYRYLPLPVVRGVQLSQGLQFAFSAIKYIRYQQDLASTSAKVGPVRPWFSLDGLALALVGVLFLVLTTGAAKRSSKCGGFLTAKNLYPYQLKMVLKMINKAVIIGRRRKLLKVLRISFPPSSCQIILAIFV
ncbi:hypothetical protein TSUD_261330 [Trifolium subterraneum]|nr:hypothetical protein TSUD_261330 [Trifolium subterraneum]